MRSAIRFLRSQIAEIERDDALRWYGVAMAFLHVVTYLFWVDQRIVAFGVGLLFACRRLVPWAYAGLVLVNALKLAIMLLDYRLRMNQHYMGFFATFAYLFVPAKRDALRVLVTLFYFWAGTLKLNWE